MRHLRSHPRRRSHERGAVLHGGRSAGFAGGAAAGFLEAEKAFRRLRVHKNIPALIHALRPTILQHQKKRIIFSASSANLQLPTGHPPSKFCVDCLRQCLLPHVFTYHEVIMTNSIKITRRNLLGATAGLMAAAGLNPTSAWAQAASPAAAPAGSTAKLLPSYVS